MRRKWRPGLPFWAANASIRGRRVSPAQDAAVRRSAGSFSVAYRLSGLTARVQRNGDVLVTGRAGYIGGQYECAQVKAATSLWPVTLGWK